MEVFSLPVLTSYILEVLEITEVALFKVNEFSLKNCVLLTCF